MDLKSHFNTQSEWETYRNKIRRAFLEMLLSPSDYQDNGRFKKSKEMRNLIVNIDYRFDEISQLKVKMRQDHKALHQAEIDINKKEIQELVDVLNENFVMEILLGD